MNAAVEACSHPIAGRVPGVGQKTGCLGREAGAVYPLAPLELRLPSDPGATADPNPSSDSVEPQRLRVENGADALTSGSHAVSAFVDVIRPLGVRRGDVG